MKHFKEICAIIDAQGFVSNNYFYPREIAIVSDKLSTCFEVDNGPNKYDITSNDLKTSLYLQNFLSGIHFEPPKVKLGLPFIFRENLELFLKTIFKKLSSSENSKFATKNQQLTKLLNIYNIPNINLEDKSYKCPTLKEFDKLYSNSHIWFCSYHSELPLEKVFRQSMRCSLRKSLYIWKWIQDKNSEAIAFESTSNYF